jgi:arylsulfatase A-like enzyme
VGSEKVKGRKLALFGTLMLKTFITVTALLGLSNAVLAEQKPNIVVIFTDDQGYADLGCFGSKENQTPVLDQLAMEGTKLTSFYAQPVCGPSRSALLTGRYPVRSKGWSMPASEITFAEMLKQAGYQTACIGKWDVSNRKAIIDRMPNAQGFDYYFGSLGANDNGKSTLYRNNNWSERPMIWPGLPDYTQKGNRLPGK